MLSKNIEKKWFGQLKNQRFYIEHTKRGMFEQSLINKEPESIKADTLP